MTSHRTRTDPAAQVMWLDDPTSEGWRFVSVRVHELWHSGEPLRHVPGPETTADVHR
jgi:hypothetical protein